MIDAPFAAPDHVTCQVHVAVKVQSPRCWYRALQLESRIPYDKSYGSPAFVHTTFGDPSPGVHVIETGRATAVTVYGPAVAVAVCSCHG